MNSITIILIAQVPVLLIYLFYLRYFHIKPRYLDHLEYFLYGVLLAVIILLTNKYIHSIFNFKHPFMVGFFRAAFIEKLGAFILIYFLILNRVKQLIVVNVVISSMLLGLGFATVENISYAITVHETVIFVRLLSSVPLHVLSCGLIGYYLSIMFMNKNRLNKLLLFLTALVLPFIFHGLFDSFLFVGGNITYFVAPLLVVLIIIIEYIFAKSQSFPSIEELKFQNIHYEDWMIIQRQPQYERWILRSMGSKSAQEKISFFRSNFGFIKIFFIILIITSAVFSYLNLGPISHIIKADLKHEEFFMIFTLLPTLYVLNLFIIGIVNPDYFKNNAIRIPIIIDADAYVDDKLLSTITYQLTNSNCYLKTPDAFNIGQKMKLVFKCSNFKSPSMEAVSIWDVHEDQHQYSGTLVKFERTPAEYYFFLFKYYLYRIIKSLTFNLKLPGFTNIRKLFVRPVSIMQIEWRFNKGHVIFEQDEIGGDFYLIRRGEVDIIKTTDAGEKVFLTTLKEGDIFGEMSIVGNQPRLATAVCKTNCILAIAHGENLDVLIDSNPEFTHALIKNFANRLHESEKTMLNNIKKLEEKHRMKDEILYSLIKILLINSELTIKEKNLNVHVNMKLIQKKYKLKKDMILKLENLLNKKDIEKIIKEIPKIEIDQLILPLKKYKIKINVMD